MGRSGRQMDFGNKSSHYCRPFPIRNGTTTGAFITVSWAMHWHPRRFFYFSWRLTTNLTFRQEASFDGERVEMCHQGGLDFGVRRFILAGRCKAAESTDPATAVSSSGEGRMLGLDPQHGKMIDRELVN
jgi:hypothetical protein